MKLSGFADATDFIIDRVYDVLMGVVQDDKVTLIGGDPDTIDNHLIRHRPQIYPSDKPWFAISCRIHWKTGVTAHRWILYNGEQWCPAVVHYNPTGWGLTVANSEETYKELTPYPLTTIDRHRLDREISVIYNPSGSIGTRIR